MYPKWIPCLGRLRRNLWFRWSFVEVRSGNLVNSRGRTVAGRATSRPSLSKCWRKRRRRCRFPLSVPIIESYKKRRRIRIDDSFRFSLMSLSFEKNGRVYMDGHSVISLWNLVFIDLFQKVFVRCEHQLFAGALWHLITRTGHRLFNLCSTRRPNRLCPSIRPHFVCPGFQTRKIKKEKAPME